MIPVGSNFRVSTVERAVTPNPCIIGVLVNISSVVTVESVLKLTKGVSDILKTTTPWCSGVSSVILPKCALTTWLPYRNGSSPAGLIHTCTQWSKQSSAIIHKETRVIHRQLLETELTLYLAY